MSSVSAAEPKYKGPYWIMLDAAGGWDPTFLCDAKGGKLTPDGKDWTDDSVNHFDQAVKVGPFTAAPVGYTEDMGGTPVELYSPERLFKDHGSRILVVNGVDTTTNNHEVGNRITWSGKITDGQPALAALVAAQGSKGKDLPLAFMSAGGYDDTAGVVALARSEANLRVVQRVSYPNIIDVEKIGGDPANPPSQFFTNDTASRIQATQAERLKAMAAAEKLPGLKFGMNSLMMARQGTGSLSALAEELQSVDPVTVPKAFPAEFAGLGDDAFGIRGLLGAAQLVLHAFHAGVAVAANLAVGGFDTHSDHDNSHPRQMMRLMRGFDYIWRLAKELGIDNQLYVIVGSDFGRTPHYNQGGPPGKDHWNVTSMLLSGPGIEGNRVIGATDDQFGPMRVDPANPSTVMEDTDKKGVRIEPRHIHQELRRVGGLAGTDLDNEWALPGDPIKLLG